jgi:hypothetical protein
MQPMSTSHGRSKSGKSDDVGRPRKRPPGETLTLSFKAAPSLIDALDKEAAIMSSEQPPGRSLISRSELVKIALHQWLESRAKSRSGK